MPVKMRWKGFLVLSLLTLVITVIWVGLIGSLGYFNEDSVVLSRQFQVNGGIELRVSNFEGTMDIEIWEGETIDLEFTKRTYFGERELDKSELVIEETDETLSLSIDRERYVHWIETDFIIKVPENVNVTRLYTNRGKIVVDGVSGDLDVDSETAEIRIRNVNNVSRVSTVGGGIGLSNCGRIGSVRATTGGIEIDECRMVEYVSVGGGGVVVRDTEVLQEAHTDAGGMDIRVETIPPDGMVLSANLGGIELRIPAATQADFDMKADTGEATVDFPESMISLNRNREDEKTGTLNGGGPLIRMRANAGGLSLKGV